MTTPTMQEFVTYNENKLLAEIEDLKVIISESEAKHRLKESELVVKLAGEIADLKSQLIYRDYYKTQFKDLLMRHLELISTTAGLKTQLEDRGTDITELQSQVSDLQEQVRQTNTASNMKDWQIRFLKEDVKRLRERRREEND